MDTDKKFVTQNDNSSSNKENKSSPQKVIYNTHKYIVYVLCQYLHTSSMIYFK